MSECVRAAFSLLLELYDTDCQQSSDTTRSLYFTLLKRTIKLPWEAKAKYQRLCALLPYLGTDMVRTEAHYSDSNIIMLSDIVTLTFVACEFCESGA